MQGYYNFMVSSHDMSVQCTQQYNNNNILEDFGKLEKSL